MEVQRSPMQTIERLSLWQRWEHALMGVSVLLLIFSGTALAYHEQAWAHLLIRLMGGLSARQWIHRAAAIGLLISGLLHFTGLIFSRPHRHDFREVLPRFSDFREGWNGILYAFRGKGRPPSYGWFTPMQKLQYWGVLLGCLIMGLSGAVLWDPTGSLNFFPKWILDMMLIVHAREAQLIFIVLILWHLYDVHIAGGNFPMNPAWINGRMPREIFEKQHSSVKRSDRLKEGA